LKVRFELKEEQEYTLIHFKLKENISPKILKDLKAPIVNPRKGVILSGRGPIWLYSYLVHYYHPTLFIATYDPRLGAVVIESHTPKYEVGNIIKVNINV